MTNNWDQLLSTVFGLAILSLLVITTLFYIEHKINQRMRRRLAKVSPIEGHFFTRYLTPQLEAKFGLEMAQVGKKPTSVDFEQRPWKMRGVGWIMFLLFVGVALLFFGWRKLGIAIVPLEQKSVSSVDPSVRYPAVNNPGTATTTENTSSGQARQ